MTLRLGELCAGYNGLGMAVEEVFGATPAWFKACGNGVVPHQASAALRDMLAAFNHQEPS